MVEGALSFVRRNMRTATRIDKKTGKRVDMPQYPLDAVREAVLNALVHRDYSFHTEGMPVQLIMYTDRIVITNPGGLYGRLTVDQLGNAQPDTRNPVLVTAMETLGNTENRYSGIPTIRYAMSNLGLPAPEFLDSRGEFSVTLYNKAALDTMSSQIPEKRELPDDLDEKGLLEFCRIPRTRGEIIEFLDIASGQYALRRYLEPLVQTGAIRLTVPDKPRSRNQRYVTAE